MAKLGEAVLVVKGDFSDVQDEAKKQGKNVGSGFGKALGAAGGLLAGAAVVGQLKDAIGAASDLNESINVTGLVFGTAAKGMDTFFASSAENLGLAESTAREVSGNIGSLLGNMGFGADAAAKATETLVTRAADLGSAFNAEPKDVVEALGAALRGETEPARRFGIMLDDAAIKAEAMKEGLYSGKGAISANAKAQAALTLIMKQSNKVAGDFKNTSDGQANSARIVSAQWKDFQAQLGQALLPAVQALMGVFKDFMPVLESFAKWLSKNKPVVIAFAIAIGTVMVAAFVNWAAAAVVAAAATLLALAPFIAIGAAVALVAVVIIKNWGTIKAVTVATWKAVTGAVSAAFDFIKRWAPVVARILVAVWTGGMSELVRIIVNNWSTIIGFFRSIPGRITGALGNVGRTLTAAGAALIHGFLTGITTGWNAVSSWVRGIVQRVTDAVTGAASALYSAGWDLISGMVRGIKAGASRVIDTIKQWVIDKIPGPIRKAFGLGSPSKVFAGYGQDLMTGMALGISRNADLPLRALAGVGGLGLDVSASVRGAAGAAGQLAGLGAPIDARVVVNGSVLGLEELDLWADQRDRKLVAALGARHRQ